MYKNKLSNCKKVNNINCKKVNNINCKNVNNNNNNNNNNINHLTLLKNYTKCKYHLSFLHLNINSIFNKFEELDEIASTDFDVILLNETKLNSNVSHSFYINSNYNI